MEANMDVNQINIDFQVFFRLQNYYHYCSYAIQCGCKSDQYQFETFFRPQCYYHYCIYCMNCEC